MNVRTMHTKESPRVSSLARRSFMLFVAEHYGPEGIREFIAYASPEAMLERVSRGNRFLVAEKDGELVGMIEIKSFCHVAMLFVAPGRHRKGIGRRLLKKASDYCRRHSAGPSRITVHASPNAVGAYRRFGFHESGRPSVREGIAFTPMFLDLD